MPSKIVIRPPEYWPGLASAALMLAADIIVMADTFQYSRQSFQNRMRVRNPDGWQWVSVPLKAGQHGRPQTRTIIRQVPGWRKRHWKAILFNYRQSPYFDYYMEFIQTLYRREWISLGELNITTSQFVYRWLGGSGILSSASELQGEPDTIEEILGYYPDAQLIAPEGVPEPKSTHRLYFSPPDYRQTFTGSISGMTVLDLIFNYGPESAGILQGGSSILPAVHT
ncbi:MAG: WbqC family protein [Bacteroidetes bacterium]|nr:WbqC family protein [Bacteroidota bacterium]